MTKEKTSKPKTRAKKQKPGESGKRKRAPLGPNKPKTKKNNKQKIGLKKNKKNPNQKDLKLKDEKQKQKQPKTKSNVVVTSQILEPPEQRKFFLDQFESANGIKLSSLELDSIQDSYFLKLSEGTPQDADNLGKHVKDAIGSSWKEVLCEGQLIEGKVDPGNPAVLVVSASALRSLELLRGLRILTKECQAVKLFSKHIKIDDQVALLKNRVNIASGTPSRMKKLCEMEALGLSRLTVVVLDMHTDVKGYSLLTLPQVRDEFWDLYKSYLHQRLVQGSLHVCLYGPMPTVSGLAKKDPGDQ